MTSSRIPPKAQPSPDVILKALREAVFENPRLRKATDEEIARQLVLEGRLQEEPSPVLVAEMLRTLETEGRFDLTSYPRRATLHKQRN